MTKGARKSPQPSPFSRRTGGGGQPEVVSALSAARDLDAARVRGVRVNEGRLIVDLVDGRTVSVPLNWYPRLADGTPKEHRNFEISLGGIHWPDLDEDICVRGLLLGRKSGESARSLQRWRAYRLRGERVPVPTVPIPAWMREKARKQGVPSARKRGTRKK